MNLSKMMKNEFKAILSPLLEKHYSGVEKALDLVTDMSVCATTASSAEASAVTTTLLEEEHHSV